MELQLESWIGVEFGWSLMGMDYYGIVELGQRVALMIGRGLGAVTLAGGVEQRRFEIEFG